MNNYSDEPMCFILKEYLKFHHKYQKIYDKMIVLMMVGQFYEIYAVMNDDIQVGPDLNEISDVLNIQIAKRNKSIKEVNFDNFLMAGFPDHALIKFRDILLNHNYTIIVVDQITSPPNPERDVVEIISPGTIIDNFNKQDNNYLLSVFISLYPSKTNKNIYSIGLSLIDVSTGNTRVHTIQSVLTDEKIWKDELFRFIHYYSPSEIIIQYESMDGIFSQLEKDGTYMTKQKFINELSLDNSIIHLNTITSSEFYKPSYQNEFLSKIFKNTNGLSPIEYLEFEREIEIKMSFLFLMQFIYEHKIENTLEIKKPIFIEDKNNLILTHNSIYQLNLVSNQSNQSNHSNQLNNKYNSLLSLVNQCKTAIGRRLCKDRLLYPILNIDILNDRYRIISKFQGKYEDIFLYDMCIPSLRKIFDIEKIHRRMSLSILCPYGYNNLLFSYEYYLMITEKLEKHYPEFNDKLQILKINEFCDESKLYFDMNELHKWSLDKIDSNLFNKGIYPELDEINERYLLKKKHLECICEKEK